jgi:hypothetical protein
LPDITTINTGSLTIINIYQPPNNPAISTGDSPNPSVLYILLTYSPLQNIVLAEDFNTWYLYWQLDIISDSITCGATRLLDWLESHALELCLEPGTPTCRQNTLDLVFSNMPVRVLVEEHLRIPSNYAIIRILLDQEEPPLIQ